MDYILGGRCTENFNITNGPCDSDLNVRQGEPILPLKSHTTYYFAGAIDFSLKGIGDDPSKIKKSDVILSFTTL